MDKETERQGFLRYIASLPWDQSHEARLVYSDWLLERDEPEEAERQRNHVAAERWLRDFADQCGETCTSGYGYYNEETGEYDSSHEVWEKITYEMVVSAGHEYVKSGDYFVQYGSESARNWFSVYDEEKKQWDREASAKRVADYWRCWQIVTGCKIPKEMYERDEWGEVRVESAPFSCSC